MKVATISMSKWEAREQWLKYARATGRTVEDEALRRAYRELSLGKKVLSLNQVMREAGRKPAIAGAQHAGYQPKLAIARCHWEHCHFLYRDVEPVFSFDRDHWNDRGDWRRRFRLRPESLGPIAPRDVRDNICLRAVVPRVPIDLRPRAHLERYAVLWEAEWETVVRDPILLQPIGQDLYLVLAQWDLTELERAILFHK